MATQMATQSYTANDIMPRGLASFPELPALVPNINDASDPVKSDPAEVLLDGITLYTKKILVPGHEKPYRIAVQLFSLAPITDKCLWSAPGTAKPPATLVFCHATGIPKLTYLPVLKRLLVLQKERVSVVMCMDARNAGDSALNNPPFKDEPLNWTDAAKDFVSVFAHLGVHPSHSNRPFIGAGHSHGGGLLILASFLRPGLLSGYVGVEPITTSPFMMKIYAELKDKGELPFRPNLADGARRRKPGFPSMIEAYESSKEKPFFKRWSRESLWCYYADGLTADESGKGVRLKMTPVQEACTFEGSDSTSWGYDLLPTLRIPHVVIISGVDSEQLQYFLPGPEGPPPAWWNVAPEHKKHYEGIVRFGVRQYAKDISIARYVPGAVHKILPGGGHLIPMDQPWLIARELEQMVIAVTDDVDGWKKQAGMSAGSKL